MIFGGKDNVQAWRGKLKDFLKAMLVQKFRDIPRKCFPGREEPNRISRRIIELIHQYYRDCLRQVGFSALENTLEC